MRGERASVTLNPHRSRIIPACAGNACRSGCHLHAKPDHPRMRGERFAEHVARAVMLGSSPHARGTRRVEGADGGGERIIPACAGNASVTPAASICCSDHPRMRGERTFSQMTTSHRCGSSPHARGTRLAAFVTPCDARIIPACAGNAGLRVRGVHEAADHPRMRGERVERPVGTWTRDGSSPHARGTLQRIADDVGVVRMIPACAGNAPTP